MHNQVIKASIPQDTPLSELLKSVGVNVVANGVRGVSLFDSATGHKLNDKPCASYEFGQAVYLSRINGDSNV